MKVKVSSVIPRRAETVWSLLKKSNTLVYVSKGFLKYTSEKEFPHVWQEGETYQTGFRFFGIIPGWKNKFTFVNVDDEKHVQKTHERGGSVKAWNHTMTVDMIDERSSIYTDEIDIDAGLLTPFVYAYANVFYQYRHIRWRFLINK